MKKIAIIGTAGIPANYGGFETLTENLTKYSGDKFNYYVFCSSKHFKNQLKFHNNSKLVYLPINANGISSILYDFLSLLMCLRIKPDTVLILGVSGCLFLPVFKLITRSKIITNIDGMEWKREKWSLVAKLFLKLSERIAISFSDVLITDNRAITQYVSKKYAKDSETIAYGGNCMDTVHNPQHKKEIYALSICRIEPENNIALILEGFKKTNFNIKFIGNWNASTYGKKLQKEFKHIKNIELIDPIYDADLLHEIRFNCSVYIHGHSAGGTNPSLVEIMHYGIPVISYDCIFNRFTTENSAIFFKSSGELSRILKNFESIDYKKIGEDLKLIAVKEYKWDKIIDQYTNLF